MKNKKIEIVDAKHHKELIGDEFEVRNIIKTEKKRKKVMKATEKRQNLQAPAWFLAFEKRNNERLEKIEKDIKKIFGILEKNNIK